VITDLCGSAGEIVVSFRNASKISLGYYIELCQIISLAKNMTMMMANREFFVFIGNDEVQATAIPFLAHFISDSLDKHVFYESPRLWINATQAMDSQSPCQSCASANENNGSPVNHISRKMIW